MPRGLFVTDLDSTLLGAEGELAPRNREAFAAAARADVAVAIVTGRRLSAARRTFDTLAGLSYRLATSNGSVVLAPDNLSPENVVGLPWPLIDVLVARGALGHHELVCVLSPESPTERDVLPDSLVLRVSRGRWFTSWTPYVEETLEEVRPEPFRARSLVHVALRFPTRDEADRAAELTRSDLSADLSSHVVRSPVGPGALLEIVPRGGKGLALRYLAERLRVPPGSTAGIGDEMNDGDLLDAAGHRFVVGGSRLALHREDATVVSSAERGAVADAIEAFLGSL